MTRINSGVSPAELSDRHLLSEAREIKRIPNLIKKGKYSMVGQPKTFTLGTGHVKFFYDKQYYLLDRYRQIYVECCKRGFKVTDYSSAWAGVPLKMFNNYTPTDRDREIVRQRIAERLKH